MSNKRFLSDKMKTDSPFAMNIGTGTSTVNFKFTQIMKFDQKKKKTHSEETATHDEFLLKVEGENLQLYPCLLYVFTT